jgi:hypothetical protein
MRPSAEIALAGPPPAPPGSMMLAFSWKVQVLPTESKKNRNFFGQTLDMLVHPD